MSGPEEQPPHLDLQEAVEQLDQGRVRLTMLRQGSPLKVNLWSHNILQSRDGPFSVLRVRRCLGSVHTGSPTSIPGGNDIGGYVDTFIKQVDEQWTFIAKPEHMRGILQNDRRCQPTHRNLPKGETSTTTQAASRREKRK